MAIDKDSVDDAKDLKGILGDINAAMREMEEASKRVKNGYAATKDSLSNIISIAAQYNQYQKGNVELSSNQLKSLSERLKAEKDNLKLSQESLAKQIEKNQQQKLLNEQEISRLATLNRVGTITEKQKKQLEDLINSNKDLKQTIQEQVTAYEQAEDVINDVDGSVNDLERNLDKATKKAKGFEVLKGIGGMLGKISTPLDGMLNPLRLINQLIEFIVGSVVNLDKELGDAAKSMNMTYNEVAKSRDEMIKFAQATGDTLTNATHLQESVLAINESLGSNVAFEQMTKSFQQDVAFLSKMSHYAGLTAEEANNIAKLTLATGQSAEKFTGQLMGQVKISGIQKGIMLNEKTALKEISKTSAAIQMSFQGSAKGLADAYAKSKALGTSLDKVDDIAGSLLNFEESIEAELSAELLTGKEMNLEKARQAALNNDLATVAEEIAKHTGGAAGFAKMNRIQQEAMAKAVGMTREELAASLKEQEALKNIGVASVEAAKEKYDKLRETMTAEEALKELGDEQLAKQFEQQNIQEKLGAAQLKMADDIHETMLPALTRINANFDAMFKKVKEIIASIKETIASLGGMKTILVVIGTVIALQLVNGIIKFISGIGTGMKLLREMKALEFINAGIAIVKGAWQSVGHIPYVGPILAGTAIAAGLAGLAAVMSDGVIKPTGGSGFGDRVLFGPEGAISFNNKDTIVAGTDLFKANDMVSAPAGNININQSSDNSKDIAELKGAIIALAARPVDVAIDGKKVIEATTGAQPNTQGLESAKNSFRIQ